MGCDMSDDWTLEQWETEYLRRLREAQAEVRSTPQGSAAWYSALVRRDAAKDDLAKVRAEMEEAEANRAGARARRPNVRRARVLLQRAAEELHALAQVKPKQAHSLSLAALEIDNIIRGLQQ